MGITTTTTEGNSVSDSKEYQNYRPLIGQLVLLPATYIKPNQPLINNKTGEIEIVNKDKFFSTEDYSRYYIISNEKPTNSNLVFVLEGENGKICMLTDLSDKEKENCYVCYPAANSIIERLHNMYYQSLINNKIEFIRYAKIHKNKYAGFPRVNSTRISSFEAEERWNYIFNTILETSADSIKKKRIGVLFGTIAGADLTLPSTEPLIQQYKEWIMS